uniref:Uncharacterized protein n=1 Tax=Arundo donax TaxID=35708 RepID=A0A0A9FA30_ARUDO
MCDQYQNIDPIEHMPFVQDLQRGFPAERANAQQECGL